MPIVVSAAAPTTGWTTVTPDLIAVALGVTPPAADSTTRAQWDMWITDALMLIEARLGDLTLLDQAKLAYVVREAVVEHARHPDSVTQVTIAIDDGSTSKTYSSGAGRVSISDELWSLLMPLNVSVGAYSIPLGSPWSVP